MERLQKIIANSGICSRRKAEELILAGKVKVNGETVTELGYKAGFDDDITVDGKSLKQENKVVYLLNKPKNVISSASDDKGRTTVVDLIDSEYRVYPLGRLDFDSSGLILLSNDGELMQKLIHPRFHIEKVYEVTINGNIGSEEIKKLENGVTIEGKKTLPCTIKLVSTNPNKDTSRLLVTIREGRNRQIRKMFDSLHYKVTRLHRIREANIELGNLKSGEYRQLKPYEIKKLKQYLDRDDVQ
ncbi:MAG: rRNA pseudouridine synthase [Erysipelotrichaceae bacterium]|nr:rRNA pseudouridine synthase [Erysipelotrichaceae bacterium]